MWNKYQQIIEHPESPLYKRLEKNWNSLIAVAASNSPHIQEMAQKEAARQAG